MYNHKKIETKWSKRWEESDAFKTDVWDFSKPKFYILDMFPYTSGEGLHVGHAIGYTATDILSRVKRMQGFNVLHPMGFDSFGLPSEQYAINTGNHPEGFTQKNIDIFVDQLKKMGYDFDWSKKIVTSDADYYKWTQWIFMQLYKEGLVEYIDMPVNWCEELGTVLANDEIIDGKSERGGFPVIRKNMKQWVMKITDYADELLDGLNNIDWPESTKEIQRNWIGKSNGANIIFEIDGTDKSFEVFTTRADTIYGVTYCVLSPEHELVGEIVTNEFKEKIKAYQKEAELKSELLRTDMNEDKTGCFTGAYAINPVNGKRIPIWIADYVLTSYGTGAIMGVPAHDERDFEFASKFKLEIIPVIDEDGNYINSELFENKTFEEAIDVITTWLEKYNKGRKSINYKLRDWIFARQRYWGEPIPIVHFEDGSMELLKEDELPLILPELDGYKAKDGQAPLDNAIEWKNVVIDGKKGLRETNTMPGSAASSWYWLRYLDPHNNNELASKELMDHWLPVDLYLGGPEHAVGHLLYSRFWNRFMFDKGIVPVKEPFQKLIHQGMILGSNNEKMSKSKGNVVNPNEIIDEFGADALRLYLMFMGPIESSKPWSTTGVFGARKFLERVWKLYKEENIITDNFNKTLEKVYHQTIKKVTSDYETLDYNTAISQMMIFVNAVYKEKEFPREYALGLLKLLNPIAPFITEELAEDVLDYKDILSTSEFPSYDESKTKEDTFNLVVQINSKNRAVTECEMGLTDDEIKEIAVNEPKIKMLLEDKEVIKTFVVPNKLINFVVKDK